MKILIADDHELFLNGLEYRNLKITFENGMIKDFSCTNFEKEEEILPFSDRYADIINGIGCNGIHLSLFDVQKIKGN